MSRETPSKPSPSASSLTRRSLWGEPTPATRWSSGLANTVIHPLALGYHTLGSAARTLPRPLAYAAARRLMDAVYLGWPRGRNAARANAEFLVPHVEWSGDAHSLARAQFRRYGEYLVDAVRLDELTPSGCFDAVAGDDPVWADHWRQLEEWYERRPILFAVIHFGNWDILGGAFRHRIGPSMVLINDLGHPALDRAIQEQRARLGMTPAGGRAGLRQIVEHLQAKGTAAILFDRPPRPEERTRSDQVFGRPIELPDELHRIAQRTGAKLIPLAAARQGHEFRFQPHIDLDYTPGDPLLPAFEPALRSDPDQWYQFRELFRS